MPTTAARVRACVHSCVHACVPGAGSSGGGGLFGFGSADLKMMQEAGREAAAAQCGVPCTILRVRLPDCLGLHGSTEGARGSSEPSDPIWPMGGAALGRQRTAPHRPLAACWAGRHPLMAH